MESTNILNTQTMHYKTSSSLDEIIIPCDWLKQFAYGCYSYLMQTDDETMILIDHCVITTDDSPVEGKKQED